MSEQEIPPWLREQLARLQQLQQNLQAVMIQKQQLEAESVEIEKATEELKKSDQNEAVYKSVGPLLIKTKKDETLKDLDEKKDLCNTRLVVLGKQETRVKENLKEVENKINEMIRMGQGQPGNLGTKANT
jgi:prefoldin beta subunit